MTRKKYAKQHGLTLLELLITLAILAVVIAVAGPNLGDTRIKNDFRNNYELLIQNIIETRNQAISRGNTARLLVARVDDTYTLTIFAFNDPNAVGGCNDVGTWIEIREQTVELNTRFEVTGNRVNMDLCFFRDNSSNGGTYNLVQKDGGVNFGTSSIVIAQATGYIDATIQTGQ